MNIARYCTQITNFITYVGSALFYRGSTLLFLPWWLYLITPSEYGLLELITQFQILINVTSAAGLTHVLTLRVFQSKNTHEEKHLLGGVIATQLCLLLIVVCLSALGMPLINRFLFRSQATNTIIIAVLISCITEATSTAGHCLLINRQKGFTVAALQVINQLLTIIGTYLFVVVMKKGVCGIIYAQVFPRTLTASIQWYIAYGLYKPQLPQLHALPKIMRANLALSSPFIAYQVTNSLFNNVDRWILIGYTSLHATGVYSLGAKVGLIVQQCILMPFFSAYRPYLYKKYQDNPGRAAAFERSRYKHVFLFLTVCIAGATIGYLLGRPLALTFLPTRFHQALPLSYFLVLEKILLASCMFVMLRAIFIKRMYVLTLITSMANALNVVLDLLVVKKYGIWGCTYATVISTGAALGACVMYARYIAHTHIVPAQTSIETDISQSRIRSVPANRA